MSKKKKPQKLQHFDKGYIVRQQFRMTRATSKKKTEKIFDKVWGKFVLKTLKNFKIYQDVLNSLSILLYGNC